MYYFLFNDDTYTDDADFCIDCGCTVCNVDLDLSEYRSINKLCLKRKQKRKKKTL
jgi:hypothetical protein